MSEGTPEQQPHAETREDLRTDEPRIYVASLSDYNAGRLHGTWLSANQTTDDLEEDIQAMLARSREPHAEEWAIHDYEGFGPLHLSEYESIAHISTLGRGITEHGRSFAHWADYLGSAGWDDLERFEDAYLGNWPSMEAYAEELLDDLGIEVDALGPENLQPYITFDVSGFARDLSYDVHVAEDEGGVYLFEP
jgi:antirestriction protein